MSVWSSDDYFDEQRRDSIPEYWRRIGSEPDFDGKKVLDLGCGHGAMSVYLAERGATVLAIDLNPDAIDYATEHLVRRFPELTSRIEFRLQDAAEIPEARSFDFVVSKDTFEHVADLQPLLQHLHRLLRPGGQLITGFAPLYFSPNGAHGRLGHRLPWAHAFLPRRTVLRAASRRQGRLIASLDEVGLNGWTPAQFRAAFAHSPFEVVDLAYNAGDKPIFRILNLLRKAPLLERWVTVGIYGRLTA